MRGILNYSRRIRFGGTSNYWGRRVATALAIGFIGSFSSTALAEPKPTDEAKQTQAQANATQNDEAGKRNPAAAQTGPVPEDCKSKVPAPNPENNPQGAAPRMVLDVTEYAVDSIWSGKDIECVYRIRNEGDAELQIKAQGG